jgi:hypothetical protein
LWTDDEKGRQIDKVFGPVLGFARFGWLGVKISVSFPHLSLPPFLTYTLTYRVTRLGRIFAYLAGFLIFGQFFENYLQQWPTLFLGKSWMLHKFYKKWVGLHLGRFFHQLIRSPCSQPRHRNWRPLIHWIAIRMQRTDWNV